MFVHFPFTYFAEQCKRTAAAGKKKMISMNEWYISMALNKAPSYNGDDDDDDDDDKVDRKYGFSARILRTGIHK